MQIIKFSDKANIYTPRIENLIQMESSLFKQAYDNAKGAINGIINNCEVISYDMKERSSLAAWLNLSKNAVIAFMGERGSGKTSAMLTVASALDTGGWINDAEFKVLTPVEPSHLSESETVLDVVVSRLYNKFNEMANPEIGKAVEIDQQRKVLEKFVDVHDAIRAYRQSKEKRLPMDSGVENLASLASGNDLNKKIYELIEAFLSVNENSGKNNKTDSNSKVPRFLVLCIDDLDLNLCYGYELCEEIRKFFSLPNVIVLLSCKLQQLSDSIKQRYISDMQVLLSRAEYEPSDSVEGMAAKYLDKLVPVTHRCYMPLFNVQSMHEVMIKDEDAKEVTYVDEILNLLFQKTGIVLLKNRFGSHHFMPTQLREMVHLYAFLRKMKDVEFIETANNKVILKTQLSEDALSALAHNLSFLEDYIREHVKVQSMKHCYRKIILETMEINWEELNQRVCRMIKDAKLVRISNNDGSEEICSTKTIPENVSIGDVLYFLNQVSEEQSTYDAKCFRSFMKILYSIALVRQLFLSNTGYKGLRQLLGGLIYNPQGNPIVRGERDFQANIPLEHVYTVASSKEKAWLQFHVVAWGHSSSSKRGTHWFRSSSRVPYYWNGFEDPSSKNYEYFTLSYLASFTNVLLYAENKNEYSDKSSVLEDMGLTEYVKHYISPVLIFSADYIDALPSRIHYELEQNILKSETDGSAYYTAMVTAIRKVKLDLTKKMTSGKDNQLETWLDASSQFPLWNEKCYQNIKGTWGDEEGKALTVDSKGIYVSVNAVWRLEQKLADLQQCSSKEELKDVLNLLSFPRKVANGKGMSDMVKSKLSEVRRKTGNVTSDLEELKYDAIWCIESYLNDLNKL